MVQSGVLVLLLTFAALANPSPMDLRTVDDALEGISGAVSLIEETLATGDHSSSAKVCISRAGSAAQSLHGVVVGARDQLANALAGDDLDGAASAARAVSQATRGALALLEYAEKQCSFPEQRSGTTTVMLYGEEAGVQETKAESSKSVCTGAFGTRGAVLSPSGATKVVVHEAPWTFEERLAVSLMLQNEVDEGSISCNSRVHSRLRDKFVVVVAALHRAHRDEDEGGEERALTKAQKAHDLFHEHQGRCDR